MTLRRTLTRRQLEMLRYIAEGLTDKEIAYQMGIAHGTAQKHASNILDRLGARNRAHAVGIVLAGVEGETT